MKWLFQWIRQIKNTKMHLTLFLKKQTADIRLITETVQGVQIVSPTVVTVTVAVAQMAVLTIFAHFGAVTKSVNASVVTFVSVADE